MAYIWIMRMPAKAHPNLSLREYAIMKVIYSDHIYSDGIYWIRRDLSKAEIEA
jgi:hypothetical protein